MAESYRGVRFHTEFARRQAPSHPLLSQLCHWCTVFHEKGLAPPYPGGSYGNLSFRTGPASFIITGTSIGLKDQLPAAAFVEVLACDVQDGKLVVCGLREPSSESMMHGLLYQQLPAVAAIFHGHHAGITRMADKLGIAQSPTAVAYGTLALAEAALVLARDENFFVIREHGFVAIASGMAEAGALCRHWLQKADRLVSSQF